MGEPNNPLLNEIRSFSHRKLRPVEIKVTTGSGQHVTESRNAKGILANPTGTSGPGFVVDTKPDLQVGLIVPGLMIASQDVAQDRELLQTYNMTHILNLAPGVENMFEDDYNYKKLEILDVPETNIIDYVEECYDFIEEGMQRGNVLVHCNAGVSRSTAICCAYLMKKMKKKYLEALAMVREARPFAKPNDGFAKQLEAYNDVLFGQCEAPDQFDDAFLRKKKAEIEAEKAAISGAKSVKKNLKEIGGALEKIFAQRADVMSFKLPLKKKVQPPPQQQPAANNKKVAPINKMANNIPPPPPPPPMSSGVPPPPPPPPSMSSGAPPPPPPPPQPSMAGNNNNNKKKLNGTIPGLEQPKSSKAKIEPATTKKIAVGKVIGNNEAPQVFDPNRADKVDETPITVSSQRKMWETAHQKNATAKNDNVAPKKVSSFKPTAVPTNVPPEVPEPDKKQKKIILKPRPGGKESTPDTVRRSTKDLIDSIESISASNSQNATPGSSPGPQRKQLYYGRRQTTSGLGEQQKQQQQQQPAAPKKPTWGLRDQVDNVRDSQSPSRVGSSMASTPRQSQTPSPLSERRADKVVFGRVPPRKVSVTGKTEPNGSNELPVVAKPEPEKKVETGRPKRKNAFGTFVNLNEPQQQQQQQQPTTTKEEPPRNTTTKKAANIKPEKAAAVVAAPVVATAATEPVKETKKPANTSANTQPEAKAETTSSSTTTTSENNVRSGFAKTPLREMKEKSVNRSVEARHNKGLNRSSTRQILKLIKTKSRPDFVKSIEAVEEEENNEIEFLLNELQKEGLENIAWNEIGLDEDEIKDIVEMNADAKDSSDSKSESESESETESESESDDDDDDEEEMKHTVFVNTATLNLKPVAAATTDKAKTSSGTSQPPATTTNKVTSTLTTTLKAVEVESSSSEEESDEEEEDEEEEDEEEEED